MIRTGVLYVTKKLLNPETNEFQLSSKKVFKFTDVKVLDAKGKVVSTFLDGNRAHTNKDGNMLPKGTSRQRARLMAAQLLVGPSKAG
eukprot:11097548-Ditylum_brightwellii.AAC.1